MDDGSEQTPAERWVARSLIDESGVGKPLPRRSMQRERSVASYLRGEFMPRYMQRAAQIERLTEEHALRLRLAYDALCETYREDGPDLDLARWTLVAEWDFDEVNTLIRQHNAWYPIERDLPMNPRTGDYVLVNGHDYRKAELDAAWAARVGREEDERA
ncbi:hypothetical protein NBH00_09905 [Paraconexibacter antarcticus]|uniref:Uncharacterized protein n=1 Tax=Paraconexibacter antarcticus TaxID=2949664 RepID=A0ABY5E0Y2_9ACTN|nr:hypothetical protein [Paraconexibacter antarcticus]UTI66507.1 hypothetical protein NBH00_09905 [Paraconexibacter antarcticus]